MTKETEKIKQHKNNKLNKYNIYISSTKGFFLNVGSVIFTPVTRIFVIYLNF